MAPTKSKNTITPNEIIELKSIISEIEKKSPNLNIYHSEFQNKIAALHQSLDKTQREILLGILERGYFFVEYDSQFPNIISSYVSQFPGRDVVVFPVMNKTESDEQRPKSGTQLLYSTRVVLRQTNKNATTYTTPFFNYNNHKDAIYIAIDDFVGTGDSAYKMFAQQQAAGHTPARMCVAALAAMQNGKIDLNDQGISCYAGTTISSVFASSVRGHDPDAARSAYKAWANLTKSPPALQLGYGDSEAMAVMIRTPDNTLGGFWHEFRSGSVTIPPIFRRDP